MYIDRQNGGWKKIPCNQGIETFSKGERLRPIIGNVLACGIYASTSNQKRKPPTQRWLNVQWLTKESFKCVFDPSILFKPVPESPWTSIGEFFLSFFEKDIYPLSFGVQAGRRCASSNEVRSRIRQCIPPTDVGMDYRRVSGELVFGFSAQQNVGFFLFWSRLQTDLWKEIKRSQMKQKLEL